MSSHQKSTYALLGHLYFEYDANKHPKMKVAFENEAFSEED
jgi:hypothetical protein